jgi:hypothetical protein
LIVQRGIEMASGFRVESSITCSIGQEPTNLKPAPFRRRRSGMPATA